MAENEVRVTVSATDKGAKAVIEGVAKSAEKSTSSIGKMGESTKRAGYAMEDYKKYVTGSESATLALVDADDRLSASQMTLEDRFKQWVQVQEDHESALEDDKEWTDKAAEAKDKAAAATKRFRWAVGLASGAVAGLVGGLVNQVAGYALTIAMGERARKEQDSFAKTLDKTTAAITDQTRAEVVRVLADKGTLSLAKELGISLGLIADAALGDAEAQRKLALEMDRVSEASSDSHLLMKVTTAQLGRLTDGVYDRARSLDVSIEKTKLEAEALALLTNGMERGTEAIDDYNSAVRAATDPVFALQRALEEARTAQRNYNKAMESGTAKEQSDALWALTEAQIGAMNAANNGELSFTEYNKILEQMNRQGISTTEQLAAMTKEVENLTGEAAKFDGPYIGEVRAEVNKSSIENARRVLESITLAAPTAMRAYLSQARVPGHAAGGISGGGPSLVGEYGPEIRNLNAGDHITPAGQTAQMLAGGGGSTVNLVVESGGSRMDDLLVEILRKAIRVRGGNVQGVIGS